MLFLYLFHRLWLQMLIQKYINVSKYNIVHACKCKNHVYKPEVFNSITFQCSEKYYLIRLIYLSYFFNFRNIIVHIAIFPFNLLFLKGHCKYESIHKVNCYFFLFRKVHIKNVIYNKEITENCINFHREYIFWQFSTSKTYFLKCKSSTFQSSN